MSASDWRPTRVREVMRVLDTSTEPVEVLTDAGRAYLKHPENREGAHTLACEWIGTALAQRLGLTTFPTVRLAYDGAAPIGLTNGRAGAAPVFATQYVRGFAWDGSRGHLELLENPDDLTRLVVLDTWLRNNDRHVPTPRRAHRNESNVYFGMLQGGGRAGLVAMDFSQLFLPLWPAFDGARRAELAEDERVYGLFPEFVPFLRREPLLDALSAMGGTPEAELQGYLETIPDEWGVNSAVRAETAEFLLLRAGYLGQTLVERLEREAPEQLRMPPG